MATITPWKTTRLCIMEWMAVVILWIAISAKGDRDGTTNWQVIRVFHGAPRGFPIYHIPKYIGVSLFNDYTLSGPDHTAFELTDSTIKVDEYPRLSKSIGQHYNISLLPPDQQSLPGIHLNVIVSEENKFQPRFSSRSLFLEAFRRSTRGSEIGTVEALDQDLTEYNKRVLYSLRRPSALVEIDGDSGVIRTSGSLSRAPQEFKVEVVAENEGSPALSAAVNLTIAVRDLSAPLNVSVRIFSKTAVRFCWARPRHGLALTYQITLGSVSPDTLNRTMKLAALSPRPCINATITQPFDRQWVQIRGQAAGSKLGMPAEKYFYMDERFCEDSSCSNCVDGVCTDGPACTGDSCLARTCNCHLPYPRLSGNCRDYCVETTDKKCFNGGTVVKQGGQRVCRCPEGYFGNSCQLYNHCLSNVCHNGGTCRNISATKFQCHCPPGYYGDTCESYNMCTLEPCLNGGYCKNISNTEYYCYCYHGYYGQNCTKFDPCVSAPCQNNGICNNISDTLYACKCQSGFYGYECELYNPCLEDPCLHGGMCNSIDGKVVCECVYGYFGPRCEYVNLCQYQVPCGSHAVKCHNVSNTAYKCICEPGWSGERCTTFNPCFNNPCLHKGSCQQISAMDYRCHCATGYYGDNCEFYNHCLSSPCRNGGSCSNVSSTDFRCHCPRGYYGKACEHFDPCSKAACQNEGTCVNKSSTTYQCSCPKLYFGELCQYYNTCALNPCKHGACEMSTMGERTCHCEGSYTGEICDIFDPCASNPCLNGGDCYTLSTGGHKCICPRYYSGDRCNLTDACHSNPCKTGKCINLPGNKYYCTCPRGKFGDLCDSSDPCANQPCSNGGTCYSVDKKHFSCRCDVGFSGDTCSLFDPCSSQPCKHGSTCNYIAHDSYSCDCSIEFQGENCEEEIPCNAHGKRCYNDGQCKKFPNGTAYCRCLEGYYGFRCENYNPCTSGNACLHGGSCDILDNGMFRCFCQMGFFGDRCEYHQPCSLYACKNNGTCVQSIDGDICYCKSGFTGVKCEQDLDECFSQPCDNGGSCVDLPGAYYCQCPHGYAGHHCDDKELCAPETVHTALGTFQWPATGYGKTALLECLRHPGFFASRGCAKDGEGVARWLEPDAKECPLTVRDAREALETLEPFTNASVALRNAIEIREAVKLLDAVMTHAYGNAEVSDRVLGVIDEILDLDIQVIFDSNRTAQILSLLEKFMSNAVLTANLTLSKRNFEIDTRKISWKEHDTGAFYTPQTPSDITFNLPAEIFQRHISSQRVKFLYFRTSKLYHSNVSLEGWQEVDHIVSITISLLELDDLAHCMAFTMPTKQISSNSRCAYWNPNEYMWSTEGVETISYRGHVTKCCSSHLSSFAVIDQSPALAVMTSVEEDRYLGIFSHVGQSVAILFLITLLFIYMLIRELSKKSFGQFLIIFAISLVLQNIVILIGYSRFQVPNDSLCYAVGLLTHYLGVGTLGWAAVLAQDTLLTLTPNTTRHSYYMCTRLLLVWGLPLICVGTALGIDKNIYIANPISCSLPPSPKYIFCTTHVLPGMAAICVNMYFFMMLFRALLTMPVGNRKGAELELSQVFGIICAQFILCLSWLTSYISTLSSVEAQSVYFICAHFSLNGLLGFTELVFHVLFQDEVRLHLSQLCNRNKKCKVSRRRVAGKATESIKCSHRTGEYLLVLNSQDRDSSQTEAPGATVMNSEPSKLYDCAAPVSDRPFYDGTASTSRRPARTSDGNDHDTVRNIDQSASANARSYHTTDSGSMRAYRPTEYTGPEGATVLPRGHACPVAVTGGIKRTDSDSRSRHNSYTYNR